MKKIALVAAIGLAAIAANAEAVVINHETAGSLEAELQSVLVNQFGQTADEYDYSVITELTITGDAAMNATDFVAIRANLRPSLLKLDLSQATFSNNILPGDQYGKEGILNKMNITECILPETLTGLSGGVFFECKSLAKVNIPKGVTTINHYCFNTCESLVLDEIPEQIRIIRPYAFQGCKALPATLTLPKGLTEIYEYAFASCTNIAFSEWPENLTMIKQNAFASTKVTFSYIPSTVTTLGVKVFYWVNTLPEFEITNVGNMWTKIPSGMFFGPDGAEFTRTFVCRAPEAPAAVVSNEWGDGTMGSFGLQSKMPFNKTTMKVLASALESYQNTSPYSGMNLEVLTTTIAAPTVILPEDAEHNMYTLTLNVAGTEHTDFTQEVYEGEGTLKIDFTELAKEGLYVDEVRYDVPAATAEEGEGEETEEPTDPNLLYKAETTEQTAVEVPITVSPDMPALRITIAKVGTSTGISELEAQKLVITRQGDTVYFNMSGAELYDIAGQRVAATSSNSIDLSGLGAGLYILRAGKQVVKIVK